MVVIIQIQALGQNINKLNYHPCVISGPQRTRIPLSVMVNQGTIGNSPHLPAPGQFKTLDPDQDPEGTRTWRKNRGFFGGNDVGIFLGLGIACLCCILIAGSIVVWFATKNENEDEISDANENHPKELEEDRPSSTQWPHVR